MAKVRSISGKKLNCMDPKSWIGEKLPQDGDSVVIASGSHFIDTFPNPPRNRAERRAMAKQKMTIPPKVDDLTIEGGSSYGPIRSSPEENTTEEDQK